MELYARGECQGKALQAIISLLFSTEGCAALAPGYLHRKRCVLPSRQVIPSFFTLLLAFPSAAFFQFFIPATVYFGLSPVFFFRCVSASASWGLPRLSRVTLSKRMGKPQLASSAEEKDRGLSGLCIKIVYPQPTKKARRHHPHSDAPTGFSHTFISGIAIVILFIYFNQQFNHQIPLFPPQV